MTHLVVILLIGLSCALVSAIAVIIESMHDQQIASVFKLLFWISSMIIVSTVMIMVGVETGYLVLVERN
jgi:uncharacterized membrane protein YhaH (DUF805 family)